MYNLSSELEDMDNTRRSIFVGISGYKMTNTLWVVLTFVGSKPICLKQGDIIFDPFIGRGCFLWLTPKVGIKSLYVKRALRRHYPGARLDVTHDEGVQELHRWLVVNTGKTLCKILDIQDKVVRHGLKSNGFIGTYGRVTGWSPPLFNFKIQLSIGYRSKDAISYRVLLRSRRREDGSVPPMMSGGFKAGYGSSGRTASGLLILTPFFRITMGEITRRLTDLLSDAHNRGLPAGRIRSDAIQWCLGNNTHDDASLQEQVKQLLVERQASRIIKFDTRHMVQAVKIREILPLQQKNSTCICWTKEIQECGLTEYSAEDRQLVAGIHHEVALGQLGVLTGTGITVQYNSPIGEATMTAMLGLLLKLYKIVAAM